MFYILLPPTKNAYHIRFKRNNFCAIFSFLIAYEIILHIYLNQTYICIYECVVCIPIERCVRRRQSDDGLRQHVSHVSRYSLRCNICRTDKPDFTRKNLFFSLLSTCSDGEIFGTKKNKQLNGPDAPILLIVQHMGKSARLYSPFY